MDEFQADIICMCEPNLDINKPEVMEQLNKRLKKIDSHAKLAKSISSSIFSDSHFKMGGRIMFTQWNWSGHIQDSESERLEGGATRLWKAKIGGR